MAYFYCFYLNKTMSKRTVIIVAIIILVLAFIGLLIAVIVKLSSPSSPSSPVVPATQKYACDAHGNCVVSSTGTYPDSTCGGQCKPPQKQFYSCSGNVCTPNATGTYTDSTCGGKCEPSPPPTPISGTFSCSISQNQCISDKNGPYLDNTCAYQCGDAIPPPITSGYVCNGESGQCEISEESTLGLSQCLTNNLCVPPLFTNFHCVKSEYGGVMCVPGGDKADPYCTADKYSECELPGNPQTYRCLNDMCVEDPVGRGPYISDTCNGRCAETTDRASYFYNNCYPDPDGFFPTMELCKYSKAIGSSISTPSFPIVTKYEILCTPPSLLGSDIPACTGNLKISDTVWATISGTTLWSELPTISSSSFMRMWATDMSNFINHNTVGLKVSKLLLRIENPMLYTHGGVPALPFLPVNMSGETYKYGMCDVIKYCILRLPSTCKVYFLPYIDSKDGFWVDYPPSATIEGPGKTDTGPPITPYVATIAVESDIAQYAQLSSYLNVLTLPGLEWTATFDGKSYDITTYTAVDVNQLTHNSFNSAYKAEVNGFPSQLEKIVHLAAWWNLIISDYNSTNETACPLVTGCVFDAESSGFDVADVASDIHFYAEKYNTPLNVGFAMAPDITSFVFYYGQGYLGKTGGPMRGGYRIDEWYPELYNLYADSNLAEHSDSVDTFPGQHAYKGNCVYPNGENVNTALLCGGDADCAVAGYPGTTCTQCYNGNGAYTKLTPSCNTSIYLAAKNLNKDDPTIHSDQNIITGDDAVEALYNGTSTLASFPKLTGWSALPSTFSYGFVNLTSTDIQDALNRVIPLFSIENMYKASCMFPDDAVPYGGTFGTCQQCGQIYGFGTWTPAEIASFVVYFFKNITSVLNSTGSSYTFGPPNNPVQEWGIFQTSFIPLCWKCTTDQTTFECTS